MTIQINIAKIVSNVVCVVLGTKRFCQKEITELAKSRKSVEVRAYPCNTKGDNVHSVVGKVVRVSKDFFEIEAVAETVYENGRALVNLSRVERCEFDSVVNINGVRVSDLVKAGHSYAM